MSFCFHVIVGYCIIICFCLDVDWRCYEGVSSLSRQDVCKGRLFQTISVATHVATLRRVNRYKLALRCRQAARGREEEARGDHRHDLGIGC